MEEAIELIEIYGLGYVGRDGFVACAEFWNAVDEDGELNGNAFVVEPMGHGDDFRGAPTVAVENDAGVLLFGGTE